MRSSGSFSANRPLRQSRCASVLTPQITDGTRPKSRLPASFQRFLANARLPPSCSVTWQGAHSCSETSRSAACMDTRSVCRALRESHEGVVVTITSMPANSTSSMHSERVRARSSCNQGSPSRTTRADAAATRLRDALSPLSRISKKSGLVASIQVTSSAEKRRLAYSCASSVLPNPAGPVIRRRTLRSCNMVDTSSSRLTCPAGSVRVHGSASGSASISSSASKDASRSSFSSSFMAVHSPSRQRFADEEDDLGQWGIGHTHDRKRADEQEYAAGAQKAGHDE